MTPPYDYQHPVWKRQLCHNWHNYISPKMREKWDTFTDEQKRIIAENADRQASDEEWD